MKQQPEVRHPVVFFINGIGDGFMNLPALRALAQGFRKRLTLVCGGNGSARIFEELEVGRRVVIDSVIEGGGRTFEAAGAARRIQECDLFISLVPWQSASLKSLLQRLRPALSVGFVSDFDVVLPLDYSKHSAELAFDVVRFFKDGCRLSDFEAPPRFPDSALNLAQSLLEPLGNAPLLAIHADTSREKMWDSLRMQAVLERFLARHPDFVAFLVGSRPVPLQSFPCQDRLIPCYGLPLLTSLSLVSQADLFLGVDSCMLHAADLSRVPGVGLFGPTRAEEFGFLFGPHVAIQAEKRMGEIPVEMVEAALEALLADPGLSRVWTVGDRPPACRWDGDRCHRLQMKAPSGTSPASHGPRLQPSGRGGFGVPAANPPRNVGRSS